MEQQPRYSQWFHRFLIFFALWAFALLSALQGGRLILSALDNDPHFKALFVLVGALFLGLGGFALVTRFDLAAFRARAPGEVCLLCLGAAGLLLAQCLLLHLSAEDVPRAALGTAGILVLWAMALRRYFKPFGTLFKN